MSVDPIDLLVQLLRCVSVTPNEGGALSLLENILNQNNFACQRLLFGEKNNKIENLFARIGNGKPHICFAGHTDVVPAGNIETWKYPPFEGKIVEEKIFGRGAVDMKGSIASFVAAIIRWCENNNSFNGSLSLLITGDEEGEAINGTKRVLEWMKGNNHIPDMCIVGEPTNQNEIGDMIKIGRRGSLNGKLSVFGKQGHVAYPHLAENPFPILLEMLAPLLKGKLDEGTEFFPETTASVTSIDTGNISDNVIPLKVDAKFNIRFNDGQTKDSLGKRLKDHFDLVSKNYEVQFYSNADPFLTENNELINSISKSVNRITLKSPSLSTSGGTSDARFITKYCPVIEFGLVGKTMHQIDENVSIKDIKLLSEIYYDFIENNLR